MNSPLMDLILRLFHTLFPLKQETLNDFVNYVGPGKFHLIIFLIIFCETGFVVTPFLLFSILGAAAWVAICLSAGFYFGRFKFVREHFELVVVAIIIISILPIAFEFLKARSHRRQQLVQTDTPKD